MSVNLVPLILVAFCAVIGALFGELLLGLAVGLGVVLAASLLAR